MTVNPNVRRKARARALEFLFSLEFTSYPWREAREEFWQTFATKPAVCRYAEALIDGVMENQEVLDRHINANLTRWSPERVGRIERAILRAALYEIAFEDTVPRTVAINEAVELAKRYGSDEAPGFVNALLDRIPEEELHALQA